MSNATLQASGGDGFRIAPNMSAGSHVVNNLIVLGNGRFGVNSVALPAYVDVSGVWSEDIYNQTSCTVGCRTSDPLADGSLRYIPRIEAGSSLKGSGLGGSDYGANIIYRYGADGSFWGEAGYNSLTATTLWPWPNEARVKQEMCADSSETRGFCSAQTLTRYIWEYLGNSCPTEICTNYLIYLPLTVRGQ